MEQMFRGLKLEKNTQKLYNIFMQHTIDDECPCNPIDFFSFRGCTVMVHDYSDEGYIPPPKALVLAIRMVMLDAQADRVGDVDVMVGDDNCPIDNNNIPHPEDKNNDD
jgi:hypothetical protein